MRTICLACALAGCGIADFDIDQPIVEQRVQGSPLPGPLASLFPLPLDLDLRSRIEEMETGPIDSVTLTSLAVSITDTARPAGDSDDWAFVESIELFVTSEDLPRRKLASATAPGGVTTLEFTVESSVNLKPYIDAGGVVESIGMGTAPMDDVSYDGNAVFTVHPL